MLMDHFLLRLFIYFTLQFALLNVNAPVCMLFHLLIAKKNSFVISFSSVFNSFYILKSMCLLFYFKGSVTIDIPTTRRVYETVISGLEKIGANYPIGKHSKPMIFIFNKITSFVLQNLSKKVPDRIIGDQITNVLLVIYVNVHLIVQLIDYIIGMLCCIDRNQHFVSFFSSRSCGEGICEQCSPNKRLVPERDWLTPVRVCKTCEKSLNEPSSEHKQFEAENF